jgi:hypothetical protein
MQPEELLPTLVEFSVAVAGFTGVVAALSPHRPADWSVQQRAFFSALLGSTAISAGGALLGMVLLASPVSEASAWTATSSAHMVALLAVLAIRFREARSLGVGVNPTSAAILAAVIALFTVQAVNAAALHTGWLCVAGLGAYAFLALLYFVALVRELWGDPPAV